MGQKRDEGEADSPGGPWLHGNKCPFSTGTSEAGAGALWVMRFFFPIGYISKQSQASACDMPTRQDILIRLQGQAGPKVALTTG